MSSNTDHIYETLLEGWEQDDKERLMDIILVTLSCVGKLGSSAAFSLIYLYTAEMFPTEVRTKALGTCSMVARVGSFISPYIASLGSSYQSGRYILLNIKFIT